MNEILKAALEYREHGYSVVPILPGQKNPPILWKEFQTRKATPDEIRAWWIEWPTANVAIICGKISGIDCIDCDGPYAQDNLEIQSGISIPETVSETTTHGKHLIFQYHGTGELKNWVGFADNGNESKCDLRTNGGLFVAAPSVHKSGKRYEWIVSPLIENPEPFPEDIKRFIFNWSTKKEGGREKVNPEKWFKEGIPNGQKHVDSFRYVSLCITRGMAFDETVSCLEELFSRCDPLPREGVKAAALKIVTEGYAKYGQEYIEDYKDDFQPLTPEQTTFECFKKPPPPNAVINVNGRCCLEKPIVGGIFGAGGTGKGFFALQLGVALSEGKSFGPFEAANPKGHEVLILAAEDGIDVLKRRLWAISGKTGRLPPKFHVASIVGKVGPILEMVNGQIKKTKWYDWLIETIRNHTPLDVLILDPKSRLTDLPENDNTSGTVFIRYLEHPSQEFDLSILFAAHTSKASTGKALDRNMGRGASSIVDGCRWSIGMQRLDKDLAKEYGLLDYRNHIEVDLVKTNYGPGFTNKMLFKGDEDGVLEFDNSKAELRVKAMDVLLKAILDHNEEFNKRDIEKNENGGEIISKIMLENGLTVNGKYLANLIDEMIEINLLIMVETKKNGVGRPKNVLKCISSCFENF